MTVIVCGSRNATLEHESIVRERLAKLPVGSIVIHGDCRGIDQLAEGAAWMLGHTTKPYPVSEEEWRKFGPQAGPLRNQRMLDENRVDLVIAFPGKESRGTKDMIRRATRAGIPTDHIPLRNA